MRKSLPPLRLIELALPRATGKVLARDPDFLGWRLYPEKSWPFFAGMYAGAVCCPSCWQEGSSRHFAAFAAFLLVVAWPFFSLWARRLRCGTCYGIFPSRGECSAFPKNSSR